MQQRSDPWHHINLSERPARHFISITRPAFSRHFSARFAAHATAAAPPCLASTVVSSSLDREGTLPSAVRITTQAPRQHPAKMEWHARAEAIFLQDHLVFLASALCMSREMLL